MPILIVVTPSASADPIDVNTIPANLRQYIVDTPGWVTSPWMTSAPCRDRGGDFSVYTKNVIRDNADLLAFFQPTYGGMDLDAAQRAPLILQGYRDIAAQITVPAGFCVDTLRQWAVPDPSFRPFGFRWGDYPQADNTTGQEHSVMAACTNTQGADNAPCGGFYISCDGATTQQAHQQCESWNSFSDQYVRQVQAMRDRAYDKFPAVLHGETDTKLKSPSEIAQDIMDWTTQQGMAQVVSFVIQGVTNLWAMFLKIVVNGATPNIAGNSFTSVYNLIAGVALAVAFLGWLFTLATSWKQGRMQYALFGGLKAAVGVTLAGVGAILMEQLATECTQSLISAGGSLAYQADFTQSLAKTNPFVAVIVGVVMAVCLVFALIFLVLHGALTMMWALLGGVAAAGQVHPASAGWLMKWAGRGTALAWTPFVMVGVMLLAHALMLPMDAGQDLIKQIVDVLQGLALVFALAASPAVLWELVEFVSDRAGGAAAVAGGASDRAGKGASAVGARAATAGREGVVKAVGAMKSGAALATARLGAGIGKSNTGPPGASASPAHGSNDGDTRSSRRAAPGGRSGTGGSDRSPAPAAGTSGTAPDGRLRPAANLGSVVARGFSRDTRDEPAAPGGQISGWDSSASGRGDTGAGGHSHSGAGPPPNPPVPPPA
ncbi:hypothetical protein [Amycolatopsis sp. GM8]|uniref:hypothetical protein n=1 Tax=Amycolatopsis sp. GM8 TaxID=2896530 RepID=UPI001F2BD593|nr:hypothetical protein [Amycolatopsis sp. GM8]